MSACTAGNPFHVDRFKNTQVSQLGNLLPIPLYRACSLGHLGASQTYIGPPVDRPLSDNSRILQVRLSAVPVDPLKDQSEL